MQFSDTSNKLGILQACERYCHLGDTGITSVTQILKEFTAHVNMVNRQVWHDIFMAYGGWQYDDSNQTDLPSGSTTLTTDQVSYALPTGAIGVRGIEVKGNGSTWYPLKPATEEMIRQYQAMGYFYSTSGQPEYYQMVGETIRVFPAANYTQASSFKVFFDRGSVAFASSDTTKTPGFASEYHDIIPIGASIEWMKIYEPNGATLANLRIDFKNLQDRIRQFYTSRFEQMFPPKLRVRDAMLEAM